MRRFLGSALVILTATGYHSSAYAYLDPGTGSIILQGLLAAVAGALVAGKLYWARTKAFLSSKFSPSSTNKPSSKNEQSSTNEQK